MSMVFGKLAVSVGRACLLQAALNAVCGAAADCQNGACSEDSGLLQLKSQSTNRSGPPSTAGSGIVPMRSNTEVWATYSGLDFILAQSREFVAYKIAQAPLMPGQTWSLGLGISLEMGNLLPEGLPTVHFSSPHWTDAGVKVDVELVNLRAKATLRVSSPESVGDIHVKVDGLFHGTYNIAVVNGTLVVGVGSLEAPDLHVEPVISLACTSPGFWSSVPCGIISALNGGVPGWIVDSILFFTRSHVEDLLQQIIQWKLNENLRTLPDRLPVVSTDQARVELAFRPLGMLQSPDLKVASYQVLAEDGSAPGEDFPVPGLPRQNHSDHSTMFDMAFSGSVPNSLFSALHNSGVLHHTIYPRDLPNSSYLGLDTNSLELAFYCPWLRTEYALECPIWEPCPVSATVQTSGPPVVDFTSGLNLTIPLSVDFHVLGRNETPTFFWRVNTTASATLVPDIVQNGTCHQLLKAKLRSLHTTWFEVTKTKDDSWVATALSINVFLPMLLNGPVLDKVNMYLSEGVPLKTIGVGGSRYALTNSSIDASSGRILLSSDVWLPEKCP